MNSYVQWALPGRGALRNARGALAGISEAVATRLALAPHAVEDERGEPGGLGELSLTECYALLGGETLGRLAYVARQDTPDIVPVNYLLDGRDILILSGPGPKLSAADRGAVVAFEVDALDRTSHTGRSVVVVGRASRLRTADQYRLSARPAPWASGPRHAVIRIQPTRVSGRHLS